MQFSEIIGQEGAKNFLRQVMAREKIPHSYLFTGIPGIGKTTTAMALAMALNCRQPSKGEGCGLCASCRQMMGGNYPDFMTVQPDGTYIKIHQMRELNRRLGFAPVSGRFRVCVIRHAEKMTSEAANSFLKTLEEPPPHVFFILATTEAHKVLPTIMSRCQHFDFRRIAQTNIVSQLTHICRLEDIKINVKVLKK